MTSKLFEMQDTAWEAGQLKVLIREFEEREKRSPSAAEIDQMKIDAHHIFLELFERKETELTGN